MQTPNDQTSNDLNWGNLPSDLIFEILKHNDFPTRYQPNKWWRNIIISNKNKLEFFKGFWGLKEQAMQRAIEAGMNSSQLPALKSNVTIEARSYKDNYIVYHHQRDLLTILKSLQKRTIGLKKLLEKPLPTQEPAKKNFTNKLKKVISLINDAEAIFTEISEISTQQTLSAGDSTKTLGEKLGFIPAADNSSNQNGKGNRRSITEIKQGLESLLNSTEADNTTRQATLSDLQSLSNKSRVAIKTLSKETRILNSEAPDYSYNYESMLYCSSSSFDLPAVLAYQLIENSYQETNQLQWLVAGHISRPEQRNNTFAKLPANIDPKIKNKLSGVLFPKDPAMLCIYKANELLQDFTYNTQLLKEAENKLDYREGNYGNLLHWGKFFINSRYTDSKVEKASLHFFDGLAQLFKPFWAPFLYIILSTQGPTLKEETKNFLPLLSLAQLLGADISRYYQSRHDEKFAKILEAKIKLPELKLLDILDLQRNFKIPASYQLIKLEVQLLIKEYIQQPLSRFRHPQRNDAIVSLNALIEQLDRPENNNQDKLLIVLGALIKYRDETSTSHVRDKEKFSSFMQHKLKTESRLEVGLTNILNNHGMDSASKTNASNAYTAYANKISSAGNLDASISPSITSASR